MVDINLGLNFLGNVINPNDYLRKDWVCLINEIYKRLHLWCSKWLLRGGRLVMMNFVMEASIVYWVSLAYVLIGAMDYIMKSCFSFMESEI